MNTEKLENRSCSNCINKDICKHKFNAEFFLGDGSFSDATKILKSEFYEFVGAKCSRYDKAK